MAEKKQEPTVQQVTTVEELGCLVVGDVVATSIKNAGSEKKIMVVVNDPLNALS